MDERCLHDLEWDVRRVPAGRAVTIGSDELLEIVELALVGYEAGNVHEREMDAWHEGYGAGYNDARIESDPVPTARPTEDVDTKGRT